MRCDLHVHTHCSDGAHAPEDVLRLAAEAGVEVLSLTDHDTVEAYDLLLAADGVALLPGVEITTSVGDDELHVLGYFPYGFSPRLREFLAGLQAERRERMQVGVERLAAHGMALTFEEVVGQCGGAVVSRSHLAQAMVDKGLVGSYADAFRQYLSSRAGMVPATRMGPQEAIDLVRRERGISVWAHPPVDQLERHLRPLVDSGLNGLEAYGRTRSEADLAALQAAATRHRLLRAGGSDWHGHHATDRLGEFTIPSDQIRQFLSFFDLSGRAGARAAAESNHRRHG